MQREGADELHAHPEGAIRRGMRVAHPDLCGHRVPVAIHLNGMNGIGRQRNRRKQERAVFADVHHQRALVRLERAPQGSYDLEAHLRPSVSVPAHIPRTPFLRPTPVDLCPRREHEAASGVLPRNSSREACPRNSNSFARRCAREGIAQPVDGQGRVRRAGLGEDHHDFAGRQLGGKIVCAQETPNLRHQPPGGILVAIDVREHANRDCFTALERQPRVLVDHRVGRNARWPVLTCEHAKPPCRERVFLPHELQKREKPRELRIFFAVHRCRRDARW